MILVDTNIWIEHFKETNEKLQNYLLEENIIIHPFIIGELACGYLDDRQIILNFFYRLPSVIIATNLEVVDMINNYKIYGKGLSYIDTHLLASAKLSSCKLWTLDKILTQTATELNLTHNS